MASEAAAGVSDRLSALASTMREERVRVGLGELLAAHSALAAVDAADPNEVFYALRAVFCSSQSEYEIFEAAFQETFWPLRAQRSRPQVVAAAPEIVPRDDDAPSESGDDEEEGEDPLVPAGWSDLEALRHADFAELSSAQLERVAALMADLVRRGSLRRSRRLRTSPHSGRPRHATVDVRHTIRDSLRYGGEPVRRRWQVRTQRPRRLVVVCDVSGSMRPYSHALLLYMQAFVAARRSVEAFVFGTRLTRVTAELAGRDPERALARLSNVVSDWAGGTRIGASLRTLNCEHGGRVGRGAVVIVLSDGWDRGEIEELSAEMARLRRTAHRVVWLNPLKARSGYEPLARGMAAALPHVDAFLAGNSLASLDELARLLEAGFDAPALIG